MLTQKVGVLRKESGGRTGRCGRGANASGMKTAVEKVVDHRQIAAAGEPAITMPGVGYDDKLHIPAGDLELLIENFALMFGHQTILIAVHDQKRRQISLSHLLGRTGETRGFHMRRNQSPEKLL